MSQKSLKYAILREYAQNKPRELRITKNRLKRMDWTDLVENIPIIGQIEL